MAKAGSVTHATKALNISQSALSRQLLTLEEQLGVKLFERSPKGLAFTESGKKLFLIAERMISEASNRPSAKV